MNESTSLIVTLAITLIVGVFNYLIQYCSEISPCNIEFDVRRNSEVKIMNKYNEIFDRVFYIAIFTMMAAALFVMITESVVAMLLLVIAELMYFVFMIMSMGIMYYRSKLYWQLEDKKIARLEK